MPAEVVDPIDALKSPRTMRGNLVLFFAAHEHTVDLDPPWFADTVDDSGARGVCNKNVEAKDFIGIPHKNGTFVLVDEGEGFAVK